MTGQTITSRMRMTPAPGMVMFIVISPLRLRKPTTPVACATIVWFVGGTDIRIVIAIRALFAREVRAAEAASSTAGFGVPDCVEAGGAAPFVWFACACPQAVAATRTTRSVMRRDGRTPLVVAVKRAEVYTSERSGLQSHRDRGWRRARGRRRVGRLRGEPAGLHVALPRRLAGHVRPPSAGVQRDLLVAVGGCYVQCEANASGY